jgi:hypothetical protein
MMMAWMRRQKWQAQERTVTGDPHVENGGRGVGGKGPQRDRRRQQYSKQQNNNQRSIPVAPLARHLLPPRALLEGDTS